MKGICLKFPEKKIQTIHEGKKKKCDWNQAKLNTERSDRGAMTLEILRKI